MGIVGRVRADRGWQQNEHSGGGLFSDSPLVGFTPTAFSSFLFSFSIVRASVLSAIQSVVGPLEGRCRWCLVERRLVWMRSGIVKNVSSPETRMSRNCDYSSRQYKSDIGGSLRISWLTIAQQFNLGNRYAITS